MRPSEDGTIILDSLADCAAVSRILEKTKTVRDAPNIHEALTPHIELEFDPENPPRVEVEEVEPVLRALGQMAQKRISIYGRASRIMLRQYQNSQ
jgi:hypothetical protein